MAPTTECLCRLCLRQDENLENLLDSNPNDLISRALEDIFRIKVDKNDGKPSKICTWCRDKLVDFYIFYLRVENNEKKMELDVSFAKNVKQEPGTNNNAQVKVKTEPSGAIEPTPSASAPYDSDDDDIIFVGEVENKPIDLNAEHNQQAQSQETTEEALNETEFESQNDAAAGAHEENLPDDDGMSYLDDDDDDDDMEGVEEGDDMDLEEDYSVMTSEIDVYQDKKCFIDTVDTRCQVVLKENVDTLMEVKRSKSPIPIPKFSNLGEKLMFLKKNPDLSEDDLIRVFYNLKCDLCEMELEFNSFEDLADHNRADHQIFTTKIECCGVQLIKAVLSPHVKYHLGLGKNSLKHHVRQLQTHLPCEECGELFPKESSLLNHLQTSHGKKLGKRSQTKRSSALPSYLQQKPTKIHCCDICGKSFGENRSLELHKLMHQQPRSEVETFSCDVCDAKFTKKFFMQRHKEVNHLNILRYECETCGDKFGWAASLKAHVQEKHAPAKEFKGCDVCLRPFDSITKMKKHRLSHLNQEERQQMKKYECDLCNHKFLFKFAVQRHIQKQHLKMWCDKIPCEICGKAIESRHMKIHRTTHLAPEEQERLKRFPCKYCERKFWYKFQVKKHIEIMHECKTCMKRFKSYKILREHKLQEHGIKTINRDNSAPRTKSASGLRKNCEFCEKTFKTHDYYQSHLYEWHLGGFLYSCKECPYKANYKGSFREHLKKAHNINHFVANEAPSSSSSTSKN